MRKQFALLILVASAISSTGWAQAANSGTPRERIERLASVTALDEITTKPWHAKLNITAFDSSGKNPVDGTVEYWQSGTDYRSVITFGSSVETKIKHGGKVYRGATGEPVPGNAAEALSLFLHEGPKSADIVDTEPEVRKQSFGKVSLDCIMLTRPIKGVAFAPLGLFPTYCVEPENGALLVAYDFGSRGLNVTAAAKFMEHSLPSQFNVIEKDVVVTTAKLITLANFSLAPDTFTPNEAMTDIGTGFARVSSGVMQGQILTKVPPAYPAKARAAHISGTVTMHAVIGIDGHVHQLHVMSAPDPDLAIAALAAVRQWTYKPYLLNGNPTEVDTTVIVNYNLNP